MIRPLGTPQVPRAMSRAPGETVGNFSSNIHIGSWVAQLHNGPFPCLLYLRQRGVERLQFSSLSIFSSISSPKYEQVFCSRYTYHIIGKLKCRLLFQNFPKILPQPELSPLSIRICSSRFPSFPAPSLQQPSFFPYLCSRIYLAPFPLVTARIGVKRKYINESEILPEFSLWIEIEDTLAGSAGEKENLWLLLCGHYTISFGYTSLRRI